METQTVTYQQLEENIISNARKNADYRKRLIDDPKALLESQLGQPLPAGYKISVLEESPTQSYIVLPYDPPKAGSELSDEDLESVAGGKAKTGTATCTMKGGSAIAMVTVVDIEASL